jgi:hypothetical protein
MAKKKKDKLLFTTLDPLGREVKLYRGTWYGHILLGHPAMYGQIGKVKITIETPELITERIAQNTLVYSSPTLAGEYCNVYVYTDTPESGFVRTAFIGRIAGGGTIIWPK